MKLGTTTHPKFRRLQKQLKLPSYAIVGLLEMLWSMAAQYAEDGDISRFSAQEIADYCDYEGDADEFLASLVNCRWIDKDRDKLFIHDWEDHRPSYLNDRIKKREERAAKSRRPNESGKHYPESPGPNSNFHDNTSPSTIVPEQPETVDELQATASDTPRQLSDCPGLSPTVSDNTGKSLPNHAMPCPALPSPALARPSPAVPCQPADAANRAELPEGIELPKNWGKYLKHYRELNNGISLGDTAREQKLYELFSSPYASEAEAVIEYTIARNLRHLVLTGEHRVANKSPVSASGRRSKPTMKELGI